MPQVHSVSARRCAPYSSIHGHTHDRMHTLIVRFRPLLARYTSPANCSSDLAASNGLRAHQSDPFGPALPVRDFFLRWSHNCVGDTSPQSARSGTQTCAHAEIAE